jgi:hypothetical protein
MAARHDIYRQFWIRTISAAALIFLCGMAGTYLVDPFAEFGRENGLYLETRPPTVERYKAYLARDRYTLVFGTSRAHLFSDELVGERLINLHPVYGWPESVWRFLQSLDARQISNIRRILYVIDFATLGPLPDGAGYRPFNAWSAFTYRMENLRAYFIGSYRKAMALATGDYRAHISARGFMVQDRPPEWSGKLLDEPAHVTGLTIDQAEISRLQDIKTFATAHGIPIVFMTATVSTELVDQVPGLREVIGEERAMLTKSIGEYVDLTIVPGISDRHDLMTDGMHLNARGVAALFALYPWSGHRVAAK